MMCSVQPSNVENNVVFIVDFGKLEMTKDLYCDDMGSWKHNGVYHCWVEVDNIGFISSHGKSKSSSAANVYRVTKKYFTHKTSADLKKTVAFLGGNYKEASIIYIPCVCEILMSRTTSCLQHHLCLYLHTVNC